MSRSLRPRTSRPSYSLLAGLDGDDADGSSQVLEEMDSGSDFAPAQEDAKNAKAIDASDSDGGGSDVSVEKPEIVRITKPVRPAANKGKMKQSTSRTTVVVPSASSSAGGLLGAARRHMYTLPATRAQHRHRAPPLFIQPRATLRLTKAPELFAAPSVTETSTFNHSPEIARKLGKAWGHSIGPGPVWDLLEDRGWFKEAQTEDIAESSRRPRVYHDLKITSSWEVVDEVQAAGYLPSDTTATHEGSFNPPQPVPCYFGKFGDQKKVEMAMLQSISMSDYVPGSKSHVFNTGAPVWALDWCPIHPSDRAARSYKQYLGVAPLPSRTYSPEIGVRIPRPTLSCIQIWAFGNDETSESSKVTCEMVLCLDSGPAHELKWCPLPSHDMMTDTLSEHRPRKLGLLAGTFEDGSFSVYAVPEPSDVRPAGSDLSQPVYVRLSEPVLRIELPDAYCWSFDWANSEVVAIGTTNGSIAVYNLASSFRTFHGETITDIAPTHFITVHQSAIRALAWVRAPPGSPTGEIRNDLDPTIIASGGYDGTQCLMDIRGGTGYTINRTRDVINTMTYSPFTSGPISTDHENVVKAFSVLPSTLGRGHTLMDPDGPPWDVHASDYHPILALGSADGACSTTNALRPPRRGTVPFFIHKLYQLDYSRKTGEYRMLECLLPKEMHIMPVNEARSKKAKEVDKTPVGIDAWPKEVGVHRVVWNSRNGFQAANMLASATASGLCRIDIPSGRWFKDKIPYHSVAAVRGEASADGEDVDVDEDDLSD
ncbi:General transcription factor 3C component [Pleurotus pulmonarius]